MSHLVGTGSVTLDLRDGSLLSFPTSISLLLIVFTERKKRSLRFTDHCMSTLFLAPGPAVSSSAFGIPDSLVPQATSDLPGGVEVWPRAAPGPHPYHAPSC